MLYSQFIWNAKVVRRIGLKVALALLMVIAVVTALNSATVVNAQRTIVSVADPVGDDRGPGYYGYPGNAVFKSGVFDLKGFEVIDAGDKLVFKVYVRNLGDNPWKGPNGFCLQYIHIYVHTTLGGVPARLDTLGLNVLLRPDYAWHFALLLAPGWGSDPVPKGERAALYYANGTIVVQDNMFKVYGSSKENAIVAEVLKKILPDVSNVAKWRIVVALASYDGFGPMRVRVVGPKGGEWVINGTRYATQEQIKKIALAIAAGIEPRVMDLAVYSPEYPKGISAELQHRWLDSFDAKHKIPAFVPSLPVATVIKTTTVTKTLITTTTKTIAITKTTEKTLTKMVTQTATTTIPTTLITTRIVTRTNWVVSGALAAVLFVIGLAIGYAIKRRT